MAKSREAIGEMLKASTGDEYFLVGFNDKPKLLSSFSPDPAEISNALAAIQPIGWTALLDAIHLSVAHMKHANEHAARSRAASDGGDNNSRFNPREIRNLLRRERSLYAIRHDKPMVTMAAMKSSERSRGGDRGTHIPGPPRERIARGCRQAEHSASRSVHARIYSY